MKIVTRKTTEMSEGEIGKQVNGFNEVFELSLSVEHWRNEYTGTCLGYSFHILLFNDDDELCGSYSAIPMPYTVDEEDMLFAVGTDMFIKEGYRDDLNNLLGVLNTMVKTLKSNGVAAFYGFPNDNSNKVSLAFLREKRIGLLDTYILPYRVGEYKGKLKLLNWGSMLLSNAMLGLSRLSSGNRETRYRIRKSRPAFDGTRYRWRNPEEYHRCEERGVRYVWKITDFEGVRACFLMDVHPMSKRNFDLAVRGMVKGARNEAGLFIYVGHLDFMPLSMIRIPRRFEPKTFRFDCRILDSERLAREDVFNLDNWEVDLSSYDLL